MIRIIHYRAKCIGCNACAEVAPYRWVMDDADGKSNLVEGKNKRDVYSALVMDDEWDDNLEAAESCPVNIIKVERV